MQIQSQNDANKNTIKKTWEVTRPLTQHWPNTALNFSIFSKKQWIIKADRKLRLQLSKELGKKSYNSHRFVKTGK